MTVTLHSDGSATVVRALPGVGLFVHVDLTCDEVQAIVRGVAVDPPYLGIKAIR